MNDPGSNKPFSFSLSIFGGTEKNEVNSGMYSRSSCGGVDDNRISLKNILNNGSGSSSVKNRCSCSTLHCGCGSIPDKLSPSLSWFLRERFSNVFMEGARERNQLLQQQWNLINRINFNNMGDETVKPKTGMKLNLSTSLELEQTSEVESKSGVVRESAGEQLGSASLINKPDIISPLPPFPKEKMQSEGLFCDVCEMRFRREEDFDNHIYYHRVCLGCEKLLSNRSKRNLHSKLEPGIVLDESYCEGCRERKRRTLALARGATETIVRPAVRSQESSESWSEDDESSDSDTSYLEQIRKERPHSRNVREQVCPKKKRRLSAHATVPRKDGKVEDVLQNQYSNKIEKELREKIEESEDEWDEDMEEFDEEEELGDEDLEEEEELGYEDLEEEEELGDEDLEEEEELGYEDLEEEEELGYEDLEEEEELGDEDLDEEEELEDEDLEEEEDLDDLEDDEKLDDMVDEDEIETEVESWDEDDDKVVA